MTDAHALPLQPQDPIADRAKAQGTSVDWWTVSNDAGSAANVAKGKNVALVFITADSGCVPLLFLLCSASNDNANPARARAVKRSTPLRATRATVTISRHGTAV